ncbi:hypothetical protein BgiMline_011469 [Biomphalaria glabrata]
MKYDRLEGKGKLQYLKVSQTTQFTLEWGSGRSHQQHFDSATGGSMIAAALNDHAENRPIHSDD